MTEALHHEAFEMIEALRREQVPRERQRTCDHLRSLIGSPEFIRACAALEAKGAPDLSEVPFLIHFDDADCKPRIVIGEAAARHVFKEVSSSWNAHLFVKIASNTRDDSYASKNASLAGAPQAVPEPPAPIGFISAETLGYLREARADRGVSLRVWHTDAPPSRALIPVYLASPSAGIGEPRHE